MLLRIFQYRTLTVTPSTLIFFFFFSQTFVKHKRDIWCLRIAAEIDFGNSVSLNIRIMDEWANPFWYYWAKVFNTNYQNRIKRDKNAQVDMLPGINPGIHYNPNLFFNLIFFIIFKVKTPKLKTNVRPNMLIDTKAKFYHNHYWISLSENWYVSEFRESHQRTNNM